MAETTTCGTILLVEDEHRLRLTLARSLKARQFEVIEAASAAEAIAMVAAGRFDLLLLDINLPDATGWDVLRQLRRDRHALPVVVISAVPPNPARMREFTPFAILYKPFPIDALLRLVRAACTGQAAPERPRGLIRQGAVQETRPS